MSRADAEGRPSELDALLARPTPDPSTGAGEGSAGRMGSATERWRGVTEESGLGATGYDVGEDGVNGGVLGGTGVLRSVSVASIEPNGFQPRRRFDDEALSALADSIRELGVLQPVLVRPSSEDRFELIAGERRWRAARRAGLRMIPAIVRSTEDQGALEQAIVENLHREDLNALEEAAAYQQLVDDFGLTQDEVARRVGKSRSAVGNTLRLFQLEAPVQRMVADGLLSAGHARALLGLVDARFQVLLAKRIVQEDLSVRETERAVRSGQTGSEAALGSSEGDQTASRAMKSAAGLEVERLLEDRLETKVEVQEGSGGGRIVIRFADAEDLNRIFGLL